MGERRINQVNALIKQEIGNLFLKEIEFPSDCLVTISKVETSSSLEHAKIWLTVLPTDYQKDVLKILAKNISHLQSLLNKKLVMRIVPQISFKIDDSPQKKARIDELLDKLSLS